MSAAFRHCFGMLFAITHRKLDMMKKEEDIKQDVNMSAEESENTASEHAQTEQETVNETEKEPEEESAGKEEKDPMEALKEENSKLKEQLLRTIAEFDNFRKRTNKEKAELLLNGGRKTVTSILPILDDFERALSDKSEDAVAIKKGMQMIFNKFVKTLESMGVKKIETDEADFNTDFHEAIAMVPGMGDDKKGKVIDCVQTGYTMNDQVIRHAKVAVGQ